SLHIIHTMPEAEKKEGDVVQSSFDRARDSMAKVLEAYQKAKKSGGGMSSVDLYEFPPMMRIVREAERENLEGVLLGEELKRIEDTAEFVALAQSTAGAKAIKLSHIYETRLAILDELEREGKDITELKRRLARESKGNQDTKK
ncbi:MAG: hypothetical protein AAB869_03290, partial [Patescibacteria group bacterium]